MPRQVSRNPRRRGRRYVLVFGGIEADDVGRVEVGGRDVGDVGAGVEGLVLGAVKIGRVLDLNGGVCAWDG